MAVFTSKLNPSTPTYEQQRTDMLALVDELRSIEERAVVTSNKRRPVFDERDLAPHERLARLVDPGMPFLRLHSLANYLVEDPDPETSVLGANVIAGIGYATPT